MREPQVLTVTLNASVDVSYTVPGFRIGSIHAVGAVSKVAGGKGNNVARVLAALGQRVTATGFAGGGAGQFIQDQLSQVGVRPDYVPISAESRTCITIVEPTTGVISELREGGPQLDSGDVDRFLARFIRLLPQVDLVVISGSIPPGIPQDIYGELVRATYRHAQLRTILDAAGQPLAAAVSSQPYMVKPNLAELEQWTGRRLMDETAILEAARGLSEAGPLVVVVSLGAQGLVLVSPEGAWRAAPPVVQPVNTVGSGDSLVAGLAAGVLRGLPPEEVLSLAVACGTANTLTQGVANVRPADVEAIRPQVRVERIVS